MLPPAALLATTLLLTGCVPSEPIITPAPEPSVTPIFASDEEALAAATEAYAKYLEVSDEITADGGVDVERVSKLVTSSQYKNEAVAFKAFSDSDLRTEGVSIAEVVGLQNYTSEANEKDSLVIYVCVDVSEVKILNGLDEVVTPVNRPNRYPIEVEFEATSPLPGGLKISRSETWPGADFCQL